MMASQTTLDEALDAAMQLPDEQREMLLDILHSRQVEAQRRQIADDALVSIRQFEAGELKPQSLSDNLDEPHRNSDVKITSSNRSLPC